MLKNSNASVAQIDNKSRVMVEQCFRIFERSMGRRFKSGLRLFNWELFFQFVQLEFDLKKEFVLLQIVIDIL